MHLQQIFSSTNDSLQMIFSAQGKQEKYYLFGLSWWCLWSSLGDVGDVVVDGGGVSCGFDGVVVVVVVVVVVAVQVGDDVDDGVEGDEGEAGKASNGKAVMAKFSPRSKRLMFFRNSKGNILIS